MIDTTPPETATSVAWTLMPASWECTEARSRKGWSIEDLAARASVLPAALVAYERKGDVDPIGGPGLMRLRRAFEAVGIVFDEEGLHELERPASPSYNQIAEAQMIVASYDRFAEMHAQRQMPN